MFIPRFKCLICLQVLMPKWANDAKEYSVSVFSRGEHGISVQLPKPIYEKLGNPDRVKFVIKGEPIELIVE